MGLRFGSVRCGASVGRRVVRFSSVRFGRSSWFGSVRFGAVRYGTVQFGKSVGVGWVWFELVQIGSVQFRAVQVSSVRFGSGLRLDDGITTFHGQRGMVQQCRSSQCVARFVCCRTGSAGLKNIHGCSICSHTKGTTCLYIGVGV